MSSLDVPSHNSSGIDQATAAPNPQSRSASPRFNSSLEAMNRLVRQSLPQPLENRAASRRLKTLSYRTARQMTQIRLNPVQQARLLIAASRRYRVLANGLHGLASVRLMWVRLASYLWVYRWRLLGASIFITYVTLAVIFREYIAYALQYVWGELESLYRGLLSMIAEWNGLTEPEEMLPPILDGEANPSLWDGTF
jgi:hypothetical protein